jgi:hypothetical protein
MLAAFREGLKETWLYRRPECNDRVSASMLKMKNSACAAVKREAEEEWGKEKWR